MWTTYITLNFENSVYILKQERFPEQINSHYHTKSFVSVSDNKYCPIYTSIILALPKVLIHTFTKYRRIIKLQKNAFNSYNYI